MAGRIPQRFIHDLLDRADIVEVVDARVRLKKTGKNYQARCPFHDEKTPSFTVAPDKQFYHCFGCGANGTALTFIMEYDRVEFVEAVEILAASLGLTVPREQGQRDADDRSRVLYELMQQVSRHYQQQLRSSEEAVGYLKGRGMSGTVARDFAIGYAPDGWDGLLKAFDGKRKDLMATGLVIENDQGRVYDRFRHRIMFPIRDVRGRVIGFGGRVLSAQDNPKYLNSPETQLFQKGRELYGLYEARRAQRQLKRLIVVEGYMDVVALAQHGITCAVASLGTATSGAHLQKMYRYCNEVICCFDGDSAGRQAAWRALENALPILEDGRELRFVFLPEGADPDSLVHDQGTEAFNRLLDNAISAVDYLFAQLTQGLDLTSMEGRARLASLASPHIGQVPTGVLKTLMQQHLDALTGVRSPARSQSAAAPPPAASQPGPRPPKRGSRALHDRLLRLLLQDTAVLAGLSPDRLEQLKALESGDLLSDVVKYLDTNPGASSAEVLGAWTGEADHAELVRLARQPSEIAADGLVKEFAEGVARYVDLQLRHIREQALESLRAEPTAENLRRYQALRQSVAAGQEVRQEIDAADRTEPGEPAA